MTVELKQELFPLGRTVITPAAQAFLNKLGIDPSTLLSRHVRGDWGDLSDDDKQANREALESGDRILSAYWVAEGQEKVWVITDAGWKTREYMVTTCLLPSDY